MQIYNILPFQKSELTKNVKFFYLPRKVTFYNDSFLLNSK